jgi:hypothetical protein
MKTLKERKLIQEEISRINELLGNKQIISEQLQFIKKISDEAMTAFNKVWGTAKKLEGEDIWQVGGQRLPKTIKDTFELIVSDPSYWAALNQAERRLVGIIMRSDTAYVDKTWKGFLEALGAEKGESEMDFLVKIYRKQQETGQTTEEIINEFFGDSYISSVLYGKIDDGLTGIPEIVRRAKEPKSYVELYKNIEPKFMKLLKSQYIDGIFKSKQKLIDEIESELDIISYKLLNTKGSKGKISNNMEIILNKLLASKKSTYEEVVYNFKKYLTENKIFANDAEAQKFLEKPRIKSLLEDMASDVDFAIILPLAQKWKSFIQMFDVLGFSRLYAKVTKQPMSDVTYASSAKRLGNFLLWKDPQGWKEVQRSFGRTGVKGMWIDRVIGLGVINFLIIPIVSGVIETWLTNDDVKDNIETYKKLQRMCNDKLLSEDVCIEVSNMKTDFMTERDWNDNVWKNMPIGIDKGWLNLAAGTYIDEFLKTSYDLFVNLSTGPESTMDDLKITFSDLFKSQKESLDKIGWDSSKDETTNFQILLKKGADEKNIKKIAQSPEGFKAWADVNNYNVTSPYGTKPGIGVAYKVGDTKKVNIEFEWDSANNTFKQKVTETPEGFIAWATNNGYTIITPYNTGTGIGTAYKNDDDMRTPVTFEWNTNTNNTFKPL